MSATYTKTPNIANALGDAFAPIAKLDPYPTPGTRTTNNTLDGDDWCALCNEILALNARALAIEGRLARYDGCAYNGGAQTIADSTHVALTFASPVATYTEYNNGGVVQSGSLKATSAGLWLVTGEVELGVGTGSVQARILVNGSPSAHNGGQVYAPASGSSTWVSVQYLVQLALNDVITMDAWQNSGGSVNAMFFRLAATKVNN